MDNLPTPSETSPIKESIRCFEPRPCPICGSTRSRLLHSQSFEQLSEIHLLNGYDVVVCQDCGAGFADRIPPQAIFDDYYRDLSKYEYEYRGGQGTEYEELRFRETAKTIIPHIRGRQSRILEIGCATGQLLSVLKSRVMKICWASTLRRGAPTPRGTSIGFPFRPTRYSASPRRINRSMS